MAITLPRLASLALILSLAGCSTLETAADHTRDFAKAHPVIVGVGAAVVVGGIVYGLDHHHDHHHDCASPVSLLGSALVQIQGCRQVAPERPVCGAGPC